MSVTTQQPEQPPPAQSLGAELRSSALLFAFALLVTAGVAAAAEAAVSLLS